MQALPDLHPIAQMIDQMQALPQHRQIAHIPAQMQTLTDRPEPGKSEMQALPDLLQSVKTQMQALPRPGSPVEPQMRSPPPGNSPVKQQVGSPPQHCAHTILLAGKNEMQTLLDLCTRPIKQQMQALPGRAGPPQNQVELRRRGCRSLPDPEGKIAHTGTPIIGQETASHSPSTPTACTTNRSLRLPLILNELRPSALFVVSASTTRLWL